MAMTHEELTRQMKQVIPLLKHCAVLGIKVKEVDVGKLSLELPYSEHIIGNPETGVIHGGPLTTLMDTACGFAAIAALDEFVLAPTLDLRIDYMHAAEPGRSVIGDAEVYRVSSNVIFARGIAYHEGEKNLPIAHCTATFMRLDPKVRKNKQVEQDQGKLESDTDKISIKILAGKG